MWNSFPLPSPDDESVPFLQLEGGHLSQGTASPAFNRKRGIQGAFLCFGICCFQALCKRVVSRFSRVRLSVTPWTVTREAPLPVDSPGKNTGVGCHFLLQCMKVKSESEDAQSCPTLRDPMECSLPGSSIHGISQARVLEWGAIAFSKRNVYISLIPISQNNFPGNTFFPGIFMILKEYGIP